MKFVVVIVIALQLYAANAKSLSDLFRPCKKSDPNFKHCFVDLLGRMISILGKGVPEYFIPPMDPYVVPAYERNITINNFGEGRVILKNVKVSNILKVKIGDVKIDMENHQGEIDLYHQEVKVSLQYIADGKLLDYPMHSEGLFKGKFNDIKCHLKVKVRPVEKRGIKYLTLEEFKLKAYVGGGHVDIIANDPEQQPIVDFVQNVFNQNPRPFLDLLNPIIVESIEEYAGKLVGGILALVPADAILPE